MGRLWLHSAELLKIVIPQSQLPQAAMVVMAAVSAHLREPISLLITADQGRDAVGFLGAVTSLLPEGLTIGFDGFDKKALKANPLLLQGKTVIGNAIPLRKPQKQFLIQQLTQVSATGQEATGLIALIEQMDQTWESIPSALRIHLDADTEFVQSAMEQKLGHVQDPYAALKAVIGPQEFLRLRPKWVEIPYLKQIIESLSMTDPQAVQKTTLIERLLRIITIINHHTYATPEERFFGFYQIGVPQQSALPAPANPGHSQLLLPGHAPGLSGNILAGELMATKVEYNIFYKVAGNYLATRDNQLTPRHIRIFEAIKAINLNYLDPGGLFIDPKNALKTLDHPSHLKGWASESEILEVVNHDGGVVIKDVDREIETLQEQRLIIGKPDKDDPDGVRFRVRTMDLAPRTALPHPSKIQDPFFNGEPVTVQDIFTRALETI